MALTRAGEFLARVKGLDARCDHDFAGVQPLGNDHPRLVKAQHVDISDRNRMG